jgi:hypothetical protein
MFRRLSILAPVLLFAGCSSGPYQVASVSGRITLNGNPLPGVAVMFQPVAQGSNINPGPGSYGITDKDGRYTLILIGKQSKGAVVGKHKVRITEHDETPQDPSDDSPKKRKAATVKVPSKYNRIEAILDFDVSPKGSTKADFDLTSK